jgi:hypothetical protein
VRVIITSNSGISRILSGLVCTSGSRPERGRRR